ncbi:hypothetical protein CD30_03120 [Ureibacillus massiliensis 4400831 = CIP 108448 = CCUG 49529]|uniref:Lipoprotein n=1 Tax=Ureibacillus massiliensis 4400831 = CIP 108448 = CCUG 49529 TaxID=1211035 RepID=A0A0A3JY36_9BACL|nr:hypothetical protein [Ureibacillus massiliensis]KGR91907.1 hypothetical protein CD30_03120 [Ureibacillus massiliensis 4400831 = CIP 108448 = CCUG 49529]
MKKLLFSLSVLSLAFLLVGCNLFPFGQQGTDPGNNHNVPQQETNNDPEPEPNNNPVPDNTNNPGTNNPNPPQITNPPNNGQEDLAVAFQAYIDEIRLLAPEETRIIDVYGSVSGENYVNDAIMYDALYYDVVPSYTEFVKNLESIQPSNPEIVNLHNLYVEGANIQLGAFTVMISALEEQSYELVDLANQGLAESRTLISQWQSQVQKISSQTGVSLN